MLPGLQAKKSAAPKCQTCYRDGHWSYECKADPVYLTRASRTQQLKDVRLRDTNLSIRDEDVPAIPRITDYDRRRDPYYQKQREEPKRKRPAEPLQRDHQEEVPEESPFRDHDKMPPPEEMEAGQAEDDEDDFLQRDRSVSPPIRKRLR